MEYYNNSFHQNGEYIQQQASDVVELLEANSLTSFITESDFNGEKTRGMNNVDPKIMRCSLMAIPNTKSSLTTASLPFGVTIQPFSSVKSGEVIERCRGCKAYLNPFCTFITPRMYRCPLCLRNNEISERTSLILGENRDGIVSLTESSVDYMATEEYQVNPPSPPTFLFAFDVSLGAISSGYLELCSEILKDSLERLSFNPRTMVGLIFFGSVVTVVSFNPATDKPVISVISDLSEIVKLPNMLVNCNQYYQQLLDVFNDFPSWFSGDPHCSLGYVIGLSQLILKSFGGRVTVFINQLADLDPGRVPLRVADNPTRPTANDFTPQTTYYKDMAISLWEIRVTVDLFVVGGQSVDLPTIGQLARLTGGNIFYFPNFHSLHNPVQCQFFRRDLEEYLKSDYGYDALMRVRVSRGVEIRTFIGNVFLNGTDFFRVGYFRPDFAFSVLLDISEDFPNDSAYVQAALFYHNSHSQLHISVHTLRVQVTESIPRVLMSADQHTTALIIARLLAHKALSSGTQDLVKLLGNSISDLMKVCRDPKIFGGTLSLRVPICRSVGLLPYLLFSLLTHTTFTSSELSLDERYAAFTRVVSAPVNTVLYEICPRLYDVTEIGTSCYIDSDGLYYTLIGPSLPLSYSNLHKTGVFFMDLGSFCYVLVRDQAPADLLFDLFGVSEYSHVPEGLFAPGKYRNWNSFGLALAVRQLSIWRGTKILLFVFKDNDSGHTEFVSRLKCDRTRSCQSYVEFINGLLGQRCK